MPLKGLPGKALMFELREISKQHLLIRLKGNWTGEAGLGGAKTPPNETPSIAGSQLLDQLDAVLHTEGIKTISFETKELVSWGSQAVILIQRIEKAVAGELVKVDLSGLSPGLRRLIALSKATPLRAGEEKKETALDFFEFVGTETIAFCFSIRDLSQFLGKSFLSLTRFFKGKAQYQRPDILLHIQEAGPQALPIVSIVNILLGIILAFMGAVQLRQFGAEIFVADLVALGQTRDIAPMMTAIVLAGRTGAAYAAQLGTMQVNEEIDALKTFGFSPMDFLVLPRMLALAVMMPFLVLFADALGMFGGYLVAVTLLDIGTMEYIEKTREAIDVVDILIGVFKGTVFGILVAITGCMYGMQSGRNASAVGEAVTKAVVSGILAIIIMTALFAFLFDVLGI